MPGDLLATQMVPGKFQGTIRGIKVDNLSHGVKMKADINMNEAYILGKDLILEYLCSFAICNVFNCVENLSPALLPLRKSTRCVCLQEDRTDRDSVRYPLDKTTFLIQSDHTICPDV